MYVVRLWSSRHARTLERLYRFTSPTILRGLRGITRVFGTALDRPVTRLEALVKGFLFDCKMCGDCALSATGMSCPMNCPKHIRNGPCGGVREDGTCEVNPQMRCVWVEAWMGAEMMRHGGDISQLDYAPDHRVIGSSSWLRMARDE